MNLINISSIKDHQFTTINTTTSNFMTTERFTHHHKHLKDDE